MWGSKPLPSLYVMSVKRTCSHKDCAGPRGGGPAHSDWRSTFGPEDHSPGKGPQSHPCIAHDGVLRSVSCMENMECNGAATSIRGPVTDHQHLQGHGGISRNRCAETGLAEGSLPAGPVWGPGIEPGGKGHRNLQVCGAGDGGQGADVDCKEHQHKFVVSIRVELQVLDYQRLQSNSRELEASSRFRHRESCTEFV